MKSVKKISVILGLAGVIEITGERVTSAQAPSDTEEGDPLARRTLVTKYGVALSLGGGVQDFTNAEVRSLTSVGGNWGLRLELGSLLPVSLELGYLGSAANIDSQFRRNRGTLVGTAVEGAIRGNLPTGTPLIPFAFAGLGWTNYTVTSTTFTRINDGINDGDNLLELPLGGGLAMHYRGFDADVRFTYRPTINNNLIVNNADVLAPSYASMNTWSLGAQVGMNI
jgi:hypothetical protein